MRKSFIAAFVSLLLLLVEVVGLEPLAIADDRTTCFDANGAPDAALMACGRLVSSRRTSGKDRARAYDYRVAAFYRKGDYDRAIRDFDEAIRLNPKNAALYKNRASAYTEKSDYDRAIRDLDEAIRLDARLAAAYVGRGLAYSAKGQHECAIQDYDEAIKLDPSYAGAYSGRGNAYRAKGQHDRAIQD